MKHGMKHGIELQEYLKLNRNCKEVRLNYKWQDLNGNIDPEPDETYSFWGTPDEMLDYYEHEGLTGILEFSVGNGPCDEVTEISKSKDLIELEHIAIDYQETLEEVNTEPTKDVFLQAKTGKALLEKDTDGDITTLEMMQLFDTFKDAKDVGQAVYDLICNAYYAGYAAGHKAAEKE